jgi:lysophospholipase L1-like esterase
MSPARRRIIGLAVAAIVCEVTARLAFAVRPPPPVADLQPYQMADPSHPSHKLLRPGLVETFAEAEEFKRNTGRVLGEEYLAGLRADPRQVFVRVNRDGFRGPELDAAHRAPRIVTLGDSCTFGMAEDASYPRALEEALRRRGTAVEVVNAGVEGYTTGDVLLELDRIARLRPEWVTVYIGWNGFFNEEQVFGFPRLATWRLVRGVAHAGMRMSRRSEASALAEYSKPKHPDRDAPEVRALDRLVPAFVPEVQTIVNRFKAAGARVVIFTLPGLYEVDREPTAAMLRIGHLPPYTDNPYVLAKLTARYNDILRDLAREQSVELIDLDRWSRTALQPRERYFFDSVHLTDEGQTMLGRYLADRFQALLSRR